MDEEAPELAPISRKEISSGHNPSNSIFPDMENEVLAALNKVVGELPDGEPRLGQTEMAQSVMNAFKSNGRLLVEAGTGVGKSLAYLVPAALLTCENKGTQVVISTATKILQDQLAKKDLPQVSEALNEYMLEHIGRQLRFAVLKGRGNYACQLKVNKYLNEPTLPDMGGGAYKEELRTNLLQDFIEWVKKTETGDRSDFTIDPSDNNILAEIWPQMSVSSQECIGKQDCEYGETCFTEVARERASEADIIITNHALYSLAATNPDVGEILPPHNFAIIDEAHRLDSAATDANSISLTPRRFEYLANQATQMAQRYTGLDPKIIDSLRELAISFKYALSDHVDQRISLDGSRHDSDQNIYAAVDVARELEHADELLVSMLASMNSAASDLLDFDTEDDFDPNTDNVLKNSINMTLHEVRCLSTMVNSSNDFVVFVSGTDAYPSLWMSPINVGAILQEKLWPNISAVLTSATIGSTLSKHLGISQSDNAPDSGDGYLKVESPFDFKSNGLLYVAKHLPKPGGGDDEILRREAIVNLMIQLINAAQGRTLALFTSWNALEETADALERNLDRSLTLLRQPRRQSNPKALLEALQENPQTIICATRSLWEGIDIPGPALSLLTIDRLPFEYQLDPIVKARSELAESAGENAFSQVMIPPAATLLAQGVGRLIRSTADRGVVAVMDSRLANMHYRHQLLESVPPMKRSVDLSEAIEFLEGII